MHGLVGKLIQCFVEDTYGSNLWDVVMRESALGFRDFEAMLVYSDAQTDAALSQACQVLSKPQNELLEDIGSYLVSHENMHAVRRLLRFGGLTFEDFLMSLDDLPDRVRLAIPDLEMPQLNLREYTRHQHSITVRWRKPGSGHLLTGMLRALADDYGALILMDIVSDRTDEGFFETLTIELLDIDFSQGRSFSLSTTETAA
jgi:hypothetical protein